MPALFTRPTTLVAALAAILLVATCMWLADPLRGPNLRERISGVKAEGLTEAQLIQCLGPPGIKSDGLYHISPRDLALYHLNGGREARWLDWTDKSCWISAAIFNGVVVRIWIIDPDEHDFPWYEQLRRKILRAIG